MSVTAPGDDSHGRGVDIMRSALMLLRGGDASAARRRLAEAISLIEEGRDRRLWLSAHHNLALACLHDGAPGEAEIVVERIRAYYDDTDDTRMRARGLWLRGSIARSRGRLEEAFGLLNEAEGHFVSLGALAEAHRIRREYREALLACWDVSGACYADPAHPSRTWSGQGSQPEWLERYCALGWTLEDCRIGRHCAIGYSKSRREAMIGGECAPGVAGAGAGSPPRPGASMQYREARTA